MDRLWTPWRYQYIARTAGGSGCVFCDKGGAPAADDDSNLVVLRARHNFVLLNLFPYTNGHLMIAPFAHVATLPEAAREAAHEMMDLACRAEAVLREVYGCPGLNLGMNLGECAGAGVAGHIHLHVLPRWPGDANFMTTVAETRVLPEDLATTLARLRTAWR